MKLEKRILVMDDDNLIRALVSALLPHLGYRVTVCSDGAEAIEMYDTASKEGEPFAVTILDLTVPQGVGGIKAAKGIKSMDPAAALIAATGYSEVPIDDPGDDPFAATLYKPFRLEEVADLLERLTQRRPRQGEGSLP